MTTYEKTIFSLAIAAGLVVLTGGSVGVAAAIGADKNEKTIKVGAQDCKTDTMIVRGNLFSEKDMRSRIFLLDKNGHRYQAIHYFPDDIIFSESGDTVLYDMERKKIVENMRMARQLREFVRKK